MEEEEHKHRCRSPLPLSNCGSFQNCLLLLLSFLLVALLSCHGTAAYQNYTVGDSLGWFDNLMQPKVNYQKWASAKNFTLGDFLFFNTDKNHSVVQTYNATTYAQCDYADADSNDTNEWSAAAPEYSTDPVTVPVPLLKVGPTYFFSGNYDGEQCQHGQCFGINVTYGEGLPESLRSPSEAPGPTSPDDGGTMPDNMPNFDHPKESRDGDSDSADVKPSTGGAEGVAELVREQGRRVLLGLGLLWVLYFVGWR